MYLCVCLCKFMCPMCVQVPMEAREQLNPIDLLWTGGCEPSGMGAGNRTYVLLTTEPSLQPKLDTSYVIDPLSVRVFTWR